MPCLFHLNRHISYCTLRNNTCSTDAQQHPTSTSLRLCTYIRKHAWAIDASYAFTMMLEIIINLPERYTMAVILIASASHDRSY